MLFYLTDSLIVDKGDPLFIGIYKSVRNLATQVIDGNHILTASFDVVKYFRDIFKDDLVIGLLFNKLYQDFATVGIPSDLKFYIEIVKENPVCRNENGRYICQKTYSYYLNINASAMAYLVGEDLNDTKFYEHILKWYIRQKNANYYYSFHGVGGGGKNTYRAILNELKSQHITICIIDTDKKYKECPIETDSTYYNCVNLVHSNACEYKILPLNVHEIENLIPLNYIDQFDNWVNGDANDIKKKRAFDFLRDNAEEILPYFDYKKGIKYDDMLRNSADYQKFAEKCYMANHDFVNVEPSFQNFISGLSNKAIIYPNLIGGSGTINNTLAMIDNNSCPQPELLEFQRDNWEVIGQNMLDWCVARIPESIS